MAEDGRLRITIEHCINCGSHQWCTMHKAEKYEMYAASARGSIEDAFPDVIVEVNPDEGRDGYPRLGAFEVTLLGGKVSLEGKEVDIPAGHVLFSKLKSTLWPNADGLAARLKAYISEQAAPIPKRHPGSVPRAHKQPPRDKKRRASPRREREAKTDDSSESKRSAAEAKAAEEEKAKAESEAKAKAEAEAETEAAAAAAAATAAAGSHTGSSRLSKFSRINNSVDSIFDC
eukprot:PLAT3575.12.p3 GENE.PLAT3575.12~~PLAT3575.12.p3  ORF type:complete len:231 (-),score=86.02 PLAT3575.12:297-989(-)